MHVVGKPIPRIDGSLKVTGGMTYVYDLEFPGMLYGKVLRSTVAHGIIKKIDTTKAEEMQGVVAVITAKDTPRKKFSFSGGIVPDLPDKLILCEDKVRYIGDEVAAVAAESPEIAEEALGKIDVEYEELPGVFDSDSALRTDAPRIHENGNLAYSKVLKIGDVEQAFKQDGLLFVEGEFCSQKAAHVCLEPKGCVADWKSATGDLVITTTTQGPHTLKQELGRTLDVSPSKIRVYYPPAGGAFGNKLVMSPIEPIAALLSKKTGRPVKIVNTREEEFTVSRTDYPFKMYIRLGFTRQGKIVGIESRIVADNGAYNDKGPAVLARATLSLGSHYAIPNIKAESLLVYTNKQYCTAFRGFGKPQAVYALESIMDMAAEKIGMDAIEFREMNAVQPGTKTPTGVPMFNDGLERCVKEASRRIGWQDRTQKKNNERDLSKRYLAGIGFAADAGTAAGNRKYGYNSTEAFVKLSEEGKATLITGAVEIGTGASTSLAQIVAEVLGIDVQDVEIIGYDTNVTAYDLGVFGNRTLFIHGNAAFSAAQNTKSELLKAASEMLHADYDDLEIKEGYVAARSDPSKRAKVKDVAAFALQSLGRVISAKGAYVDDQASLAPSGKVPIDPTYSFGAHAVKLQVDTVTGVVKILKYVAAHDSGTIINPLTAKGVVIGGVVQGIGYTLSEDLIMEEGRVINSNFLDYKIPAMEDSPSGIEVVFANVPDPLGPFGAKGLGENAVSPPVAAIANAIYDAIGIRFYDLPITPVKILSAILDKRKQEEGKEKKKIGLVTSTAA